LFIEWCCEWTSYALSKWALIEVLEYIGKLSLLGALLTYLWTSGERRRAAADQRMTKHYQAWQVINSAQGRAASGGRVEALQNLNADGERLVGVDLSRAYLHKLILTNAVLEYGRFPDGHFDGIDLSHANCQRANFSNTWLKSG